MNNKGSSYGTGAGAGAGAGAGLRDCVFSWSIMDVLNKDLYKDKIQQIPESFSSAVDYLNSFMLPLIEETRADFCSGLESLDQAPICEIARLEVSKYYKPPNKLFYNISLDVSGSYEPKFGDVILLTDSRPRRIEDVNKLGAYFLIALVQRTSGGLYDHEILSSKQIEFEHRPSQNKRLFVTYLMNLTTNMRIWEALERNPQSLSLIQKVLRYDSYEVNDCSVCLFREKIGLSNLLSSFMLDESQKNSILSSISMRRCLHNCSKVKLIWGPPGTGKTKTVSSLLYALLKSKCRTLTCAPTNTAVLQVAKRVMGLVYESLEHDTYGLGDIVLFGNGERMKINDHDDLVDVSLEYRVKILDNCVTGWKSSLELMMSFLKDPEKEYSEYTKKTMGESNRNQDDISAKSMGSRKNIPKQWKEVNQLLGESEEKSEVHLLKFEEFVEKTFCSLADSLMSCAKNLYTHLPTSYLTLDVAKRMITLRSQLKNLQNARETVKQFNKLTSRRVELSESLILLHEKFPGLVNYEGTMWDLCMSEACLIFCTASSSIKVKTHLEMVIIDEAAQLKECESAIPLQVPGLRNAVLVGDDRQLPALVKSKVLENMNFGRSLFQRLTSLGKPKHLLNIQYRMHPSISLFPNKAFYQNRILDAGTVKEATYRRNFLEGDMYGSYAFIDVAAGKEDFDTGHSPRNLEEAYMVDRIIAKLFKGHCNTKQRVSVGVISPYKGQVSLIQEKLGKKYDNHKGSGFSVSIRSVDGFQGGEEDVIVVSTVRCNGNGSVGFLFDHPRTNVTLTRARYCLWIVGSATTLVKSGTVWKDLVIDAKERGCFYNKYGETMRLDFIRDISFLKLDTAKWKVFFDDDFKNAIAGIKKNKPQNVVMEMLKQLSDGRCQPSSKELVDVASYPLAAELLELYKVDKQLYLAWTVDIEKEESKYTQVIRVRDILPASRIPKLAMDVDVLFGCCAVDFLDRCKYRSFEGNLVVPMSWPCHSASTAIPVSDSESLQLGAIPVSDSDSESLQLGAIPVSDSEILLPQLGASNSCSIGFLPITAVCTVVSGCLYLLSKAWSRN